MGSSPLPIQRPCNLPDLEEPQTSTKPDCDLAGFEVQEQAGGFERIVSVGAGFRVVVSSRLKHGAVNSVCEARFPPSSRTFFAG